MKVSVEEKELIRKDYLEFRSQGYTRTQARVKTAQKHDRGATTIFDNTFDLELPSSEDNPVKKFKTEWPKSYIITGWEIRVGIDDNFIATLEKMAEHYQAELLLVPCHYGDVNYIPEKLKEKFTILTEDIKFNDNLCFKYVETNALAQSPLAGHVGAYPDTSTIIPGLVKELRTEPSHQYVKQLMSTGSVGTLNASIGDYMDTDDKEFLRKWKSTITRRHGKGIAIAKNYVQPSALIVDVLDKKTFLTRFITSTGGGVVYDLKSKFTPTGRTDYNPPCLVTGDMHAYYVDDVALKATKDMIRYFQPDQVVIQDFFDGASVNHHEVSSSVKFSKAPSIKEEAEVTTSLLKELCRLSKEVVYLESNHDDFLIKFMDKSESLWRLNGNYEICCELQLYRSKTGKHPIIKLLDLESYKNLRYVPTRENFCVNKVLLKHGHEGVSGVRAGFYALAKIYNYYVQGHLHAPSVFRNAMCVGLNGRLDMEYVMGANAMMHANGLIHADGSVQLLPVVYGEWIR